MDARLSWLFTAGIAGFLVWLAFWGTSAPNSQAGGRQAIEQMIGRTFTENDPAQCTQDMTPALVEQSCHEGTTSMQRCVEENKTEEEAIADTVTIESVVVNGLTARAVVVAHGGEMAGSQVTVDLVADGGRWKLDHLADVQIDRASFDQNYIRKMQAAGITPSESRCVVRALDREVSDAEIERASSGGGGDTAGEHMGWAASLAPPWSICSRRMSRRTFGHEACQVRSRTASRSGSRVGSTNRSCAESSRPVTSPRHNANMYARSRRLAQSTTATASSRNPGPPDLRDSRLADADPQLAALDGRALVRRVGAVVHGSGEGLACDVGLVLPRRLNQLVVAAELE